MDQYARSFNTKIVVVLLLFSIFLLYQAHGYYLQPYDSSIVDGTVYKARCHYNGVKDWTNCVLHIKYTDEDGNPDHTYLHSKIPFKEGQSIKIQEYVDENQNHLYKIYDENPMKKFYLCFISGIAVGLYGAYHLVSDKYSIYSLLRTLS